MQLLRLLFEVGRLILEKSPSLILKVSLGNITPFSTVLPLFVCVSIVVLCYSLFDGVKMVKSKRFLFSIENTLIRVWTFFFFSMHSRMAGEKSKDGGSVSKKGSR